MLHNARPGSAGPNARRATSPRLGGASGNPDNMVSINFEFLRPTWPELAGLGGFAESYARPDT